MLIGSSVVAGFTAANKLNTDGVLRASKKMKEFMIATFVDLLVRVMLAFGDLLEFGNLGLLVG